MRETLLAGCWKGALTETATVEPDVDRTHLAARPDRGPDDLHRPADGPGARRRAEPPSVPPRDRHRHPAVPVLGRSQRGDRPGRRSAHRARLGPVQRLRGARLRWLRGRTAQPRLLRLADEGPPPP